MPVTVLPEKILNMNNLNTIRPRPVDISILYEKVIGKTLKRLINPKSSTEFGSMEYFVDGPITSITMSRPQEDLFCSTFGIWIGGDRVYDNLFWKILVLPS